MIKTEGKFYLYIHYRKDNGNPFYIGIGTKQDNRLFTKCSTEYSRAHTKKERTIWWKNIANKTEYEIEILLESDDYEFIKQKEIEFITLYGRRDLGTGILVNLTDGGEGAGRIVSEETKQKAREKGFPPVKYSIVDSEGIVHKGINIRRFCKERKLSHSLIYKMIISGGSSQGYHATYEQYLKNRIIVVNLKTGILYKTKNIKTWCENNFPELLNSKEYPESIMRVLNKSIKLHNNTWWACYENDWNGYIDIDLNTNKSKRFIIKDKSNTEIAVEDASDFCRKNNINISGFYDMLSGNRPYHKEYKLIRVEYIFKNINQDGTRIYIG